MLGVLDLLESKVSELDGLVRMSESNGLVRVCCDYVNMIGGHDHDDHESHNVGGRVHHGGGRY